MTAATPDDAWMERCYVAIAVAGGSNVLFGAMTETVDFDGLGIHFETRWVDEEVLHGIALISLQLNNITGLLVLDYGAIASELLLDDLQDFLEVELCWDAFNGGQGLAAVALLDTNMDV